MVYRASLCRIGVDPDRVGLTLMLGIRCVLVVSGGAFACVAQQIHHQLLKLGGNTGDDYRLIGHLDTPVVVGSGRLCIAHRVQRHLAQIDFGAHLFRIVVEPGQHEHLLNQVGHPLRSGFDAAHDTQLVGKAVDIDLAKGAIRAEKHGKDANMTDNNRELMRGPVHGTGQQLRVALGSTAGAVIVAYDFIGFGTAAAPPWRYAPARLRGWLRSTTIRAGDAKRARIVLLGRWLFGAG